MKQEPKKRAIVLPPTDYQPSKAEINEEIKLDVPGRDVHEKARNLGRALLQPVKIRYQKPKTRS